LKNRHLLWSGIWLAVIWFSAWVVVVVRIPVGSSSDARAIDLLSLNEFGALASVVALGIALFGFLSIRTIGRRLLVRERMPKEAQILEDAAIVIRLALDVNPIDIDNIAAAVERVDGTLIFARSVITSERGNSKFQETTAKIRQYRRIGRAGWLRRRAVDEELRRQTAWELLGLIRSCADAVHAEIESIRVLGALNA
jgi:hypothetical protein